jgi:hypothetical protein
MSSLARQRNPLPLQLALGGLLAVGVLLRVWVYALRGALWTDEAGLALNIVGRDFRDIARPFIYEQYAPYLYVITDKVVTLGLGTSEHALRFSSLLAGLLLLPAIAWLANRVGDRRAALFALLLLVPNGITLLYSTELKPYGQDALVASLLLLLTLPLWASAAPRRRDWLLLGACGVLAPWFSLPSVFVLATIGLALLVNAWERRLGMRAFAAIFALGSIWLISFAIHYFAFLNADSKSASLQSYWASMDAFGPFPVRSLGDLRWYVAKFFFLFNVLVTPTGFGMRYVAGACFCAGVWLLGRTRSSEEHASGGRALALLWVAPVPLVFAASAAHKYIVADRMILFMAPLLVVPVAVSLSALSRWRGLRSELAAGALVAVFSIAPLAELPQRLAPPSPGPDIRSVLDHLKQNFRPGDRLYIESQVVWLYAFYARREAFDAAWSIADGYATLENVTAPDALNGAHRVWALVPTLGHDAVQDPKASAWIAHAEQIVTQRFNEFGHQIDSIDGGNTRLYAFDVSNPSVAARQ